MLGTYKESSLMEYRPNMKLFYWWSDLTLWYWECECNYSHQMPLPFRVFRFGRSWELLHGFHLHFYNCLNQQQFRLKINLKPTHRWVFEISDPQKQEEKSRQEKEEVAGKIRICQQHLHSPESKKKCGAIAALANSTLLVIAALWQRRQ